MPTIKDKLFRDAASMAFGGAWADRMIAAMKHTREEAERTKVAHIAEVSIGKDTAYIPCEGKQEIEKMKKALANAKKNPDAVAEKDSALNLNTTDMKNALAAIKSGKIEVRKLEEPKNKRARKD